MNSKQQARFLARAVVALMNRIGDREVCLSADELKDLPPLGMAFDEQTGDVTFALGDNPP